MTDKQLKRLARVSGWVEHRKGSKHEIWRRGDSEQITIPYRPRSATARLIAKRLEAVAA